MSVAVSGSQPTRLRWTARGIYVQDDVPEPAASQTRLLITCLSDPQSLLRLNALDQEGDCLFDHRVINMSPRHGLWSCGKYVHTFPLGVRAQEATRGQALKQAPTQRLLSP